MRMNFLLSQVVFWWSSPLSSFSFWNWRLDIGEGKGVNLEKCSRVDLQWQCIKYLGPVSFIQLYIVSGFTFAFLIECKHFFFFFLYSTQILLRNPVKIFFSFCFYSLCAEWEGGIWSYYRWWEACLQKKWYVCQHVRRFQVDICS